MKIPPVTTEALNQIMDKLDTEFRNTSMWEGRHEDEVYKYAIEHNGKLYPVKKIVSLATSVPVDQLADDQQANDYVQELGFKVIEIQSAVQGIKANLDRILAEYKNAALEPLMGPSLIRSAFRELQRGIEADGFLDKHPTIKINLGVGAADRAADPWLAFLDIRSTDNPKKGIYCALLFRGDMTGVYLTLTQGVQELNEIHGRLVGTNLYDAIAKSIRSHVPELARSHFILDGSIDLRPSTIRGWDYQVATIAYKLYEAGSIPDDQEIRKDIQTLLLAYEKYLSEVTPQEFEQLVASRLVDLKDLIAMTSWKRDK